MFVRSQLADPSGELLHGLELVEKYRAALPRQHRLIFEAWRARDHARALVELHFFLVALDRVNDGLKIVGRKLGGDVAAYLGTMEFRDYTSARNHFEHLDDMLYGTSRNAGRNAPQPITENGATRTVHFGLSASDFHFEWGSKRIDVSDQFLARYLSYLAEADARIQAALPSVP